MKIALWPNLQKKGILSCIDDLIRIFTDNGDELYMYSGHASHFTGVRTLDTVDELSRIVDAFVALAVTEPSFIVPSMHRNITSP